MINLLLKVIIKCYWCLDKKEVLRYSKKTFNNNFNNIKIERFDDFKYNIYLKGNKEFNYILKKRIIKNIFYMKIILLSMIFIIII